MENKESNRAGNRLFDANKQNKLIVLNHTNSVNLRKLFNINTDKNKFPSPSHLTAQENGP